MAKVPPAAVTSTASTVASPDAALISMDEIAPIVSSQPLGWEPLLMEEFQQPPGGVAVPGFWEGHSIVLYVESVDGHVAPPVSAAAANRASQGTADAYESIAS